MSSDSVHSERGTNEHIVFLVHGIRTLMSWRRVLRQELNKVPGVDTITFYYGVFSLFRFYLPFTRERIVRKFALEFFEQVGTRRPKRVSIIAHSFGTYVVCRALQKYPLDVHTLILCGSVVPEQEKFTGWFLAGKERVQIVVNDIAQRDVWVLFGKLMIPGVGAGGLVGLSMPGRRLIERVFGGYSHGSFFSLDHYNKHWIPVLKGESPTPVDDSLEIPALYRFLIAWAKPIKLFANALLLTLLIYGGAEGWNLGIRTYTTWSARPFQIVGPAALESRLQNCNNTGFALTKATKMTIVAPPATREGKLQIGVVIALTAGSRWSIYDVEVVGHGVVRMDTPNREYWVYDISPAQQVSFLICGATNAPTGGALVDDLRIQFSNASWL